MTMCLRRRIGRDRGHGASQLTSRHALHAAAAACASRKK